MGPVESLNILSAHRQVSSTSASTASTHVRGTTLSVTSPFVIPSAPHSARPPPCHYSPSLVPDDVITPQAVPADVTDKPRPFHPAAPVECVLPQTICNHVRHRGGWGRFVRQLTNTMHQKEGEGGRRAYLSSSSAESTPGCLSSFVTLSSPY